VTHSVVIVIISSHISSRRLTTKTKHHTTTREYSTMILPTLPGNHLFVPEHKPPPAPLLHHSGTIAALNIGGMELRHNARVREKRLNNSKSMRIPSERWKSYSVYACVLHCVENTPPLPFYPQSSPFTLPYLIVTMSKSERVR